MSFATLPWSSSCYESRIIVGRSKVWSIGLSSLARAVGQKVWVVGSKGSVSFGRSKSGSDTLLKFSRRQVRQSILIRYMC